MKQIDKFVKVEWNDAADRDFDVGEYENLNPEEFLVRRTTYGKLYKKNNATIVIIKTEDTVGVEFTAIPNSWIISYHEQPIKRTKKR